MIKKSTRAWALSALLVVPAVALAVEQTEAQTGQQQTQPKKEKSEQPGQKGKPQNEKGIDAEADRMLRQMTDYLAGLQSFRVKAASIDEVVTKAGMKVEIAAESKVMVTRTNRLRSEQLGAANALALAYNGTTMSLYCGANNTYSTSPAPPTIDATIDAVRKQYKLDAPGADLLYSHPYDILTEQVKRGQVIGRETIDGAPTNHLAFQGESVDWQIWIKDGPEPLPVRYVITTKTMPSQPQFTVQLTQWEPRAKIDDKEFDFKPPADAARVDKFPTECGGK